MVLGLRSKNKKSTSIPVDYLIQLQEIKPWPPSRSLISLRSVVLQWENGDRNSGSTGPAAPSVIEGRIEFNEAFVVQVTLSKEASGKGNGQFHKNMLEFNLYEPRRDKTVKGQLLGSAAVDLAEHGILSEAVTVGVPLNCKRSFRNSTPPVLYLRIQLYEKEGSTSSSRESLSKEASMDRDGSESVSALMTEEYAEEAEIASFTDDDDDDMSSHYLMKQTSHENLPEAVDVIAAESYLAKPEPEPIAKASESTGDKFHLNESMPKSSISELSIDPKRLDNGDSPVSRSPQRSPTTVLEESDTCGIHSTTGIWEGTKAEATFSKIEDSVEKDGLLEEVQHPMVNCQSEENVSENEVSKENGVIAIIDRVESSKEELDLASTTTESMDDVKEIDVQEDAHDTGNGSISDVRAGNRERTSLVSDKVKHVSRDSRNSFSSSRVRELELKVEMLEGELREAAAIEAGLYCVVAEHGSSAHKVHTPARRLSRLYIHASKEWSRERKAGSARSAVSGLLLAAKACGNDVPRLTFWLSNSVVLRAIITQSIGYSNLPISGEPIGSEVTPKKRTPLKWESLNQKKGKLSFSDDVGDWEDPYTFTTALEKIEAWMFSRIVESIWWQTLTPHMQMINSKKSYGRKTSFGDQQQANSSIENWKRAFRDACERLCPVRAGGHECGCLPMLARLVMEQCVARLDVAMFNAILRESDDEIPTDPVSDPIGDSRVLPIPSGKLSFGSGAQLKNAIGNWSRWLTDLFGMDEDDILQDENELEDDPRIQSVASIKSFRLLYALSDLLMLPKDFLLGRSIRKEVCPTFGSSIIKRILDSFFPDEFCPDPIPDSVLEALNSEDPEESSDESIRNFPCDASPIVYSPPSITSIESIIGDVRSMSTLRRSGSSVVRKCHTSDDELDELDSPLASVIIDKSSLMVKTKGKASGNAVRYRLLREVWRDDD